MITLLTATGERQEAFDLCQRWMMHQTFNEGVRWIIVDDGFNEQKITFKRENWDIEVIRPTPFWQLGQNTQHRNLLCGLEAVRSHERLFIIEDDDYYAPSYLNDLYGILKGHDLIGEGLARYFNVQTGKGQFMENKTHASLCSTAMKGKALAHFKQSILTRTKFIDMHLWSRFSGSKRLVFSNNVVGMKGLPGRGGIGCGHRDGFGKEENVLRDWIGEDSKYYGY